MKTKSKATKDCFTSDKFYYRDSDFDNWLPKIQPAKEGTVTVHQLPQEMTFKEMAIHFLGSDDIETIKKHTLTLPMVEEMIKTRESELETTGWGNLFFVENEDGSVSVAYVFRYDDDRHWDAFVYELGYDYRWYAGYRLVLCNSDSRANSDSQVIYSYTYDLGNLETWKHVLNLLKHGVTVTSSPPSKWYQVTLIPKC